MFSWRGSLLDSFPCDYRSAMLCAINQDDKQGNIQYEPPHDKTNKMTVRPAKTQISLGIRPVWSESSLCAQWKLRTQAFFMRTAKTLGGCPGWSESSLGAHVIWLVLSWGGSIIIKIRSKLLHCVVWIWRHLVEGRLRLTFQRANGIAANGSPWCET